MTTYANPRSHRFRHIVFKGHERARPICAALAPIRGPGPSPGPVELSRDEAGFLEELFARVGLDVGVYRGETLRRRLPACLRALRAGSVREGRQRLEKSPELAADALEAAVIAVTAFFRDTPVFEHLRTVVLPQLAQRGAPLRCWSAGCADGQELYSAAILLSEQNLLADAELLGTDCRAGAIMQAREAIYDGSSVRAMPSPWLEKYFLARGTSYPIVPTLRQSVRWRRADVTRCAEPGPWDLIFCRNLAMYLRPAAAGAVWLRLEQSLRHGGFLVVGKAERPSGASTLVPHAPCIYRRVV